MINRQMQFDLEQRLTESAAVVLLGPRQVGKTTLARQVAAKRTDTTLYLDLERPVDRRRLDDADMFLRTQAGKLTIIDEVHRVPELFGTLRGIIDDRRYKGDRVGHFLLLGSASLDLMQQAGESLAGRVDYLELAPVNALELDAPASELSRLWVRGGFPDSLLAADDTVSMNWRRAFIRSYLERDVPMFAPRLPAETVGRFWTMLAHAQAMPFNQSRFAASLGIAVPTVGRYLNLLVDLLLVRRLRPWSSNIGKRLVKTPKIFIRDSGLMHALLELPRWDALLGFAGVGASWEGFVIENLIAAAGTRRTPYYYRTQDGSEMDLLFERAGRVEIAVEIKHTTAPTLSKGFHLARAALQPEHTFVVHAGQARWPIADGVTAIALPEMMRLLMAGA